MPSSTPLNVSWLGGDPYEGGYRHLTVTFSDPAVSQTVSPSGLFPESAGLEPVLSWDQFVDPYGWPSSGVGLKSSALGPTQYGPAIWHLSASWESAEVYLPPALTITATWANVSYITPLSIDEPAFPDPRLYWEEFAGPPGFESLEYGPVAVLHPWQYVPSRYLRDASWVGKEEYSPATGERDGVWRIPVEDAYIATIGFTQSDLGQPEVYLYTRYVEASGDDHAGAGTAHEVWNWAKIVKPSGTNELKLGTGAEIRALNRRLHLDGFQTAAFGTHALESTFFDVFPQGAKHEAFGRPKLALGARRYDIKGFVATAFGAADLENLTKQAWPPGINQSAIGAHEVENTSHAIRVNGFVATKFPAGWPNVWNLRQILKGKGFSALGLGKPSVSGGRATIEVKGLSLLKFGTATVFDPNADQYIELKAGIPAPGFGWVNVSPRMVYPAGILSAKLGLPAVDFHFYDGNGIQIESWDSLLTGQPRVQHLSRVIRPGGMDSVVFGASSVSNFARGITVPSIRDTGVFGDLLLYNKRIQVHLQGFDALEIPNWTVIYSNRRFLFGRGFNAESFGQAGVDNYATTIEPWGADQSRIGSPSAELLTRYLATYGSDYGFLGRPAIGNMLKTVLPAGIGSKLAFGKPAIKNLARFVYPSSAATGPAFGRPYIWNLLQIRKLPGFDASEFGEPFFGGGVRHITAGGREYLAFGGAEVINTTADQFIKLNGKGIEPPKLGNLNVSPQILYPFGIYGTSIEGPLVQFPPFPRGWESSRAGHPAIEYWTKWTYPEGISPAELVGYPRVFDPTREIYAPSILGTGVFGDILIVNRSRFIRVPGEDYFEGSDWAELRSNRRTLEARGFDAPEFGEAEARNKTPSFTPAGFDAAGFGWPAIGNAIRYIYGRGWHYSGYGRPTLTKTPSIHPVWPDEDDTGAPTVWHRIRAFDLDGIDSQDFGGLTVWYRVRRIPIEGEAQGGYGEPRLDHSRRGMLAWGASHDRYGKPNVSNLNRVIYPDGVFKEFAHVHTVGGTRWLKVFGFEATRFGARIIPESQTLYPEGFGAPFGWALVENDTQILEPGGITTGHEPSDRWGKGKVYNLRQFIELYFFEESELNPPGWSRWTLIENRSKALGVTGQAMDKHGEPSVFLNARLLMPPGMAAPEKAPHYKAGMVSYWLRRLQLEGMEAPYLSTWQRIYNDAFVIRPDGFVATIHGQAEAEKTRRYFNRIGGFLTERVSEPMIAFRIRELLFEPRYSIAPPRINLHTVDLYTRYIDGIGDNLSAVGLPSLSIHFNKVTTRWTHKELFGWADLRNLTPEMRTRGRASDEYGNAFVRLEWRPLPLDGQETLVFGRTHIADRDRSIVIEGIRAGAIGDKLKVIKGGQPPYTEQFIFLDGHGFQSVPKRDQVPSPSLNQSVLYTSGFESEKFGAAFCQSNALIMDYGIKQDDYGRPSFSLKMRYVTIAEGLGEIEPPKARVSPHTIWARPAPSQATNNHPLNPWRPVGETNEYPAGERFGKPRVSTWRGQLYPRSDGNESSYGKPRAYLKRRYVEVTGIRSFRMGWHKLGDGSQEIVQFASKNMALYGKPAVERPPYTGPQTVKPDSLEPTGYGKLRIEHLHREVRPSGRDMLGMGRSRGNNPYAWPGLAVSPPMPTIPECYDASLHGEAWVSYRVRGLELDGFDTFRSEYDLENFAGRMRVRNAFIPVPEAQGADPVGVDLFEAGVPNIQLATHYIKPDGNANQYRKGAF